MLIAAVVVVAIVKPWGDVGLGGAGLADQAAPTTRPADAARRTAAPTPAEPDAADRLAEVCLAPSGWRVMATERWRDETVRSWRAVEPSTASGPLDPSIEFTPVAAEALPALGYCAPIDGPDRPPADARGSVYVLRDGGADERAVTRVAPLDDVSGGAAWFGWDRGASDGAFSLTWPVGRYVIRVGTADGRYARWIGVEVLRPFLERSAPSPSTLPG